MKRGDRLTGASGLRDAGGQVGWPASRSSGASSPNRRESPIRSPTSGPGSFAGVAGTRCSGAISSSPWRCPELRQQSHGHRRVQCPSTSECARPVRGKVPLFAIRAKSGCKAAARQRAARRLRELAPRGELRAESSRRVTSSKAASGRPNLPFVEGVDPRNRAGVVARFEVNLNVADRNFRHGLLVPQPIG